MTLEVNNKPQKWFSLLWAATVLSVLCYGIWIQDIVGLGTLACSIYIIDKLLNKDA